MGDAELPAADNRDYADGRMFKRVAQNISADHSSGAHDDKRCIWPDAKGTVHERVRSSSQST